MVLFTLAYPHKKFPGLSQLRQSVDNLRMKSQFFYFSAELSSLVGQGSDPILASLKRELRLLTGTL